MSALDEHAFNESVLKYREPKKVKKKLRKCIFSAFIDITMRDFSGYMMVRSNILL